MDDELVKNYLEARAELDMAKANLDNHQARLIKQMEADQRKSFRWQDGDQRHAVTYVQKHTVVINEPGLRKALTAKVFDKYTKRVLDRRKMEEAIDMGAVDKVTVAQYAEMKPQRAYLEYRVRQIEENK